MYFFEGNMYFSDRNTYLPLPFMYFAEGNMYFFERFIYFSRSSSLFLNATCSLATV